jgi:DNA-binding transcriptional regulator YbjK
VATAAPPDTRERILRATAELISREGVGAVTNRRVASAAEVALGSLTYHFPSQVDLLRESLLLFVGEEVARQEAIARELGPRRLSADELVTRVERVIEESSSRVQLLAELELHLQAARDPELQDASRRCFEAYEKMASAGLRSVGVPDAERHARSVVALMYGLGVRRLGTGSEDATGIAEALLAIIRGAGR